MRVTLVSRDRALYKLCQEVLGELLDTNWTFSTSTQLDLSEISTNDLYIWDFEPGGKEFVNPGSLQNLQNLVCIAQRKHLDALRSVIGSPEVNVILRPVARPTLHAFLGDACLRWKERNGHDEVRTNELRAARNEMLQCLIHANLKLQEYDQERTNFLARAVHDFRAPLTAISGYCGLLLFEQLGAITDEQREVLERMQHSAKRLSRMANAMFQLSIAQKAETQLNFQKGDIRECIDQALHEISPFTNEKGIAVSVDFMTPPESLSFERSQLEQVMVNLLDNACKFTSRGGTIDIRAYPFFWERRAGRQTENSRTVDRRITRLVQPNSFRIDIRDSGPGIPAGHLETIFEEYTSYSGGHDRSGGGLGLAICKMIMNQHQGRVWASSNSSGATFSVVLPFQRTDSHLVSNEEYIKTTYYAGVI